MTEFTKGGEVLRMHDEVLSHGWESSRKISMRFLSQATDFPWHVLITE